jgi:hypothetical protein
MVPAYAREVSNDGCGLPLRVWVASDSASFMLSDDRFRCNNIVVLGPPRWWPFWYGLACPSSPLSVVVLHFCGFGNRMSAVYGWSCGCALSLLSSLSVVFWLC